MQNNDNLIALSIIRSLQDMELESFKVMCIIETPFWTKWCLCYASNSIPRQNVYNVSEPRHYNDPDVILCHNLTILQ